MPQSRKSSKQSDRLKLLAERMAILMVICRLEYGIGWKVWLGEGLYTGETGDEFRSMPEYMVAMDIIRNMLRRQDAAVEEQK